MRIVIIGPAGTPRLQEAEALGFSVQLLEGPHDVNAQALLWMSINRLAPDVVWCVWDTLRSPDVELIRQFRVIRGQTRLVVELPDQFEPPNAAVSALVSLGIYDLVPPTRSMQEVLPSHPQYGDVARWHLGTEPLDGSPTRVPVAPRDPEIAAAQTIAVISGKGGVGKTSFVANCLVASAPWGAVGIDADYIKPTLPLAFQAPDAGIGHELDQLLAALEGGDGDEAWSARDEQIVRDWVRQADMVRDGVRLIPGPSRARDVLPTVPPGLVTALVAASQRTARLTLIDTPGSTMEQSWVEAVQIADWIVLVTTPDYAAVLESVDVLRKLDLLQIPRNRIWLVISHRGKSGYSTAEITQTQLPLPLLAVIPDNPALWHQAWRLHRPPALQHRKFWMGIVEKMTGLAPDRPNHANPFRVRRRVRSQLG